MSPILINSTSNPNVSAIPRNINNNTDEEKGDDDDPEQAREERKATGRSIAIVIFLSLMCLAIYHVIQRKTTILAGVLVPALILFTYLFFVIHVSNKEKKKRKQLESSATSIELSTPLKTQNDPRIKKISNASVSPSLSSSISNPSSSGRPKGIARSDSMRAAAKMPIDLTMMGDKKKAPFRKIPSQSHIQVKSNHSSVAIENETKKLKKTRSFDKHSNLSNHRHAIDSNHKKSKTKSEKV